MGFFYNFHKRRCVRILMVFFLVFMVYMSIEKQKEPSTYSVTAISLAQVDRILEPLDLNKVKNITLDFNVSESEIIFPAHLVGPYIFNNVELCKGVEQLDFIIIVNTAPDHLERRRRIRQSFANESLFLPFRVRVAFLLGRPAETPMMKTLRDEHESSGDTVMGDFVDTYHNLTLKGVMGYRWVTEHCRNSRFVLKIDDDVVVNMYKLLFSFYGHMTGKRKSIFCNHFYKNTVPIFRQGKWGVSSRHFPTQQYFPYDYCSGFFVITTTDLAAPMFRAAQATPFFWIDDFYLYGMLLNVAGGVTYHDFTLDQNVTLESSEAFNCTRSFGIQCPIVASHVKDEENFWPLWNMITEIYVSRQWKVKSLYVP